MQRERVVVIEHLDERDIPVREAAPPRLLPPMPFAGTGPARGEYESAIHLCTESGEMLSEQERAAMERFLRYWRAQTRRAA